MSGRPRVLIASRLFTPEVSAGAFRLRALATALGEQADVTVVTSRPPKDAGEIVDPPGVEVSRAPVLRDRSGNVRGYVQYASFDGPLLFRLLGRRFDVAVSEAPPTTGLVTSWISALKRARFVYYAADVWTDGVRAMGAHDLVVRIMARLERLVLRRADAVLSASDVMTERLIELGADPGKVVTVRNGVDTSIFRPDAEPAAPGELYFAYTGTMSEWQRPEVFIQAFASIAERFPDLRLRFFGQGSQEDALKALAEEQVPGRVEFGGLVPPASSARWIRGAVGSLVSLVPGIGYDIAQPTKAFAGAACGTPVLFAGAEPAGQLIRDAGLGIATGFDVGEIAEGMAALVEAWRDGSTEELRRTRAAWAEQNASLAAVGQRGARAALSLIGVEEAER